MRRLLSLLGLLLITPLCAADAPEQLRLEAEYPVAGMPDGNLSGLAHCDGELLAVSDRVDNRIFHLTPVGGLMRAKAEPFIAPPAPPSNLPWGVRVRGQLLSLVRGNELDFEGISCDSLGNRYLVSETHATVLQVPRAGEANWLVFPDALVRQARASGIEVDQRVAIVCTIRDGRAVRWQIHPTRDEAIAET